MCFQRRYERSLKWPWLSDWPIRQSKGLLGLAWKQARNVSIYFCNINLNQNCLIQIFASKFHLKFSWCYLLCSWHNTVARSCVDWCYGNATMPSVCIVGLQATVNNVTVLSVAHQYFYGEFTWPRKIKFTCIHVKFPVFLTDFNQIWNFWRNTCPEVSWYCVGIACYFIYYVLI